MHICRRDIHLRCRFHVRWTDSRGLPAGDCRRNTRDCQPGADRQGCGRQGISPSLAVAPRYPSSGDISRIRAARKAGSEDRAIPPRPEGRGFPRVSVIRAPRHATHGALFRRGRQTVPGRPGAVPRGQAPRQVPEGGGGTCALLLPARRAPSRGCGTRPRGDRRPGKRLSRMGRGSLAARPPSPAGRNPGSAAPGAPGAGETPDGAGGCRSPGWAGWRMVFKTRRCLVRAFGDRHGFRSRLVRRIRWNCRLPFPERRLAGIVTEGTMKRVQTARQGARARERFPSPAVSGGEGNAFVRGGGRGPGRDAASRRLPGLRLLAALRRPPQGTPPGRPWGRSPSPAMAPPYRSGRGKGHRPAGDAPDASPSGDKRREGAGRGA
jgi:hypothetical protein